MPGKLLTWVLVALVAEASAQQPRSLDGKWFAEFLSPDGNPLAAELVISDGAATWKGFSRGAQRALNPCIGPQFPATAQ